MCSLSDYFFLLLDLHDVKKGDLINVNRYVNLVISGTANQKTVGLNGGRGVKGVKVGGFSGSR